MFMLEQHCEMKEALYWESENLYNVLSSVFPSLVILSLWASVASLVKWNDNNIYSPKVGLVLMNI